MPIPVNYMDIGSFPSPIKSAVYLVHDFSYLPPDKTIDCGIMGNYFHKNC